MQSIGSYRADAAGWAADECCFQRKRLNLAFAIKGIWKGDVVVCYVCVKGTDCAAAVDGIWKGDVVICFVCVRGELITLPRSKYMDRYFGCSFFTTFFLREKESGGKKSAYKGDCAAIRCAPIRRKIPLIYPPMTALPIAPLQDIVRNARQALCLAFLIERMHV